MGNIDRKPVNPNKTPKKDYFASFKSSGVTMAHAATLRASVLLILLQLVLIVSAQVGNKGFLLQ